MTIVYAVFKLLAFPGTYVKGFLEHLVCRILGLPVESAVYLGTNDTSGHVDHALAKKPLQAFVMALVPSIISAFIGFAFSGTGYLFLFDIGIGYYESKSAFVFGVFMLYIGISFLCNVFPMVEDAMNLYDILYSQKKGNVAGRIVAFIPTALLYAGAYLERYCVTSALWLALVIVAIVIK